MSSFLALVRGKAGLCVVNTGLICYNKLCKKILGEMS